MREAEEAANALALAQERAERHLRQLGQGFAAAEEMGLGPEDLNVGGLLGALEGMGNLADDTAFMIQAPFLATAESIENAEQAVDESVQNMEAKTARLAKAGLAVGNAFGTGMAALVTGSKSAKVAIKDMVSTIVSGALRASQANIIAAMTNAGIVTGPAAPFVIPALVASGIALVEGLFAAIPAMATGGITTGPVLSLLGDNPSGKEAVIPFERMGEFLNMAGVGEGQHTQVTGRLQGMDLLLSNERASLARNRTT